MHFQSFVEANGEVNEAFVNDRKTEVDSASMYSDRIFENRISNQLESILSSVRLMTLRVSHQRSRDKKICEWMLVAQVLDRIFLVIFFILIAVVHMAIFIACGMRS